MRFLKFHFATPILSLSFLTWDAGACLAPSQGQCHSRVRERIESMGQPHRLVSGPPLGLGALQIAHSSEPTRPVRPHAKSRAPLVDSDLRLACLQVET